MTGQGAAFTSFLSSQENQEIKILNLSYQGAKTIKWGDIQYNSPQHKFALSTVQSPIIFHLLSC